LLVSLGVACTLPRQGTLPETAPTEPPVAVTSGGAEDTPFDPPPEGGSLPPAFDGTGFGLRAPIAIVAGSAVPAGHAISIDVHHAKLVKEDNARPDGNDVRIVFDGPNGPVELDRVVDPFSDWERADTTLWFRAAEPIAEGKADGRYFLYYDHPSAGAPPADPRAVYAFWDGFDDASFEPWQCTLVGSASGACVMSDGRLTVSGGEGELSSTEDAVVFAHVAVPTGAFVADARVELVSGDSVSESFGGLMVREGLSPSARFHAVCAGDVGTRWVAAHRAAAGSPVEDPHPGAPKFPCFLRLRAAGSLAQSGYSDDGGMWAKAAEIDLGSAMTASEIGVLLVNPEPTSSAVVVDWVRVRAVVGTEPAATLGEEESLGS
jgi:hypothetical protein